MLRRAPFQLSRIPASIETIVCVPPPAGDGKWAGLGLGLGLGWTPPPRVGPLQLLGVCERIESGGGLQLIR